MAGVDVLKAKKRLEEVRKADADKKSRGEFYSLKEGKNSLRLLPPWGENGEWCREVGYHFRVVEKKALLCPKITFKEDCPICEEVSRMFKGSEEDKKHAREISSKQRCYANVLDLDAKDGKVKIFQFGPMIRDKFLAYFADDEVGDFTNVDKGRNVKIEKSGEGMQTDYSVIVSISASPVSDWPNVQKQIVDFDKYVQRERLPYAKLKGILEGTDNLEDAATEAKSESKPESTSGSDRMKELEEQLRKMKEKSK